MFAHRVEGCFHDLVGCGCAVPRRGGAGWRRRSLLLLGLAACGSPTPLPREPAPVDYLTRPHYTPYTQAPEILNRDEIVAALVAAYPPELLQGAIGGTVRVYFLIDELGAVLNRIIDQSSGYSALDRAALEVASVYRFAPATNGEEPVYAWVSFPITFNVAR